MYALASYDTQARVVINRELPMRFFINTFPQSLKIVIAVLLASVFCGWFAADPWAALRIWPNKTI